MNPLEWGLVLAGALIYLGVAALMWPWLQRLLPPRRERLTPWGILEIFAVVYVVMLLIPFASATLLTASGLGEALYGKEVMALARSGDTEEATLARMRVHITARLIDFPLQVLTVLGLLWRFSRTRPYQLGLSTHRIGTSVLLGILGWAIVTPAVLTLFYLTTQLFELLSPQGVQQHPFEKLSRSGALSGLELGAVVFLAAVTAPVLEELLFRGLLLRWLGKHDWGAHAVMGLCLLWSMAYSLFDQSALQPGLSLQERVQALAPVLFVLLLLGAYWWMCQRQQTPVPAAIFASSLLFAVVHSFAWPSPVPLFVLALGLGWLAWRTQCLIGPMVLHSLFNAVACVQLLAS